MRNRNRTPSKTWPNKSSKEAATEIPTEKVATPEVNIQFFVGSPESGRSISVPSVVGSPGVSINRDFLSQYNINLARQVAMGSQLRLRFEQEVKLLKKARSKITRRDQRNQVREEEIKKLDQEIKSLKTIETEVHGLRNQAKNLENLLEAEFAGLQVSNNQLSEQVSTLQTQVTGEERIKTTFEEFKKYEDDKVEQRCAKVDVRLDKLSVDFDEELYPHMLTAIASRRLAKGMSEGLKYGIEHGKADRDLADIEAYDPEANSKLVKSLQDFKDLNYPMVDQLEGLKDAPIELIMTSL
ncbi:hypothetical protein Tco_1566068, partial [Tanacetum coccineum]